MASSREQDGDRRAGDRQDGDRRDGDRRDGDRRDGDPRSEAGGRVVPFVPRTRPEPPATRPVPRPGRSRPAEPPVPDLGRYGQSDEPDDERRRLVANLLAAALLAGLTAAGLWIASTMADLRKDQDCVLSGRRNCAGLPAAPPGTPPGR